MTRMFFCTSFVLKYTHCLLNGPNVFYTSFVLKNLVYFFSFPRAIVNNFVTERNSAEVMAVGLNAVRWVSTCLKDPGS